MAKHLPALIGLFLLGACAPQPTLFDPAIGALPVLHPYDATRADRGHQLLTVDTVSEPAIPLVALENLWVVWPGGYVGDYWAAFRERYGLHEAPFDNAGLPMGIRRAGFGYGLGQQADRGVIGAWWRVLVGRL